MEPECTLSCSQESATGLCSDSAESSPHTYILFPEDQYLSMEVENNSISLKFLWFISFVSSVRLGLLIFIGLISVLIFAEDLKTSAVLVAQSRGTQVLQKSMSCLKILDTGG
jgi:hypothetical protein